MCYPGYIQQYNGHNGVHRYHLQIERMEHFSIMGRELSVALHAVTNPAFEILTIINELHCVYKLQTTDTSGRHLICTQ